jgi:serine/threonine protein kinase/class 3 adenylate cyclase
MNVTSAALERRDIVREFGRRHSTGLLTLLFTDLVGSTELKQRLGDMTAIRLIQWHHRVVRGLLAEFAEAREVDTAGDSFFLVFAKPSDAVTFAVRLQKQLESPEEATGKRLQDRIGIHVGEVIIDGSQREGEGDFYGMQVDACARVMSLGTGGQILMSRFAFDTARQVLRGQQVPGVNSLVWHHHGRYKLKGIEEPFDICEVGEEGKAPLVAPKSEIPLPESDLVPGWRPAVAQLVPRTHWILGEKLGEGGFGEVWVARHQTLKEDRVFKFCFRADRARSLRRELTLFRLLREKVGSHRHIVGIQEVNLDEPPFYLVMERASGSDLRKWSAQQGGAGAVPIEVRLEIVAQTADALQAAHDAGVIHRDVKPANILIHSESGDNRKIEVKITDFGIGQVISEEVLSKVTRNGFTGTVLFSESGSNSGTQLYMAPELLAGRPATPRSDVHALGVVLFQLIVGDLDQPLISDWQNKIQDPLLREDLNSCLTGDAEQRISAGQLAQKLRNLPARRAERERKAAEEQARERRAYRLGIARAAAVAGIVVLLLITLTMIAVRQARRADALAKAEGAGRRFAEEIIERQMKRTSFTRWDGFSALAKSIRQSYPDRPEFHFGVSLNTNALIYTETEPDDRGTYITIYCSVHLLNLLDRLSRALAMEQMKTGFLRQYVEWTVQSTDRTGLTLWQDARFWDDKVLNESQSYYNELCGKLFALEIEKLPSTARNTQGSGNTQRTPLMIFESATRHCLESGIVGDGYLDLWKALAEQPEKPKWATLFMIPGLQPDEARRRSEQLQKDFFEGKLR